MAALVIRAYRDDDLQALVQLINDADRVDDAGFATTTSALAHRIAEPDAQPRLNVFLAERGGRLVGYVGLCQRREDACERVLAVGIVHPSLRRQRIGTALMKRAEERARGLKSDKPLFLEMLVREPVTWAPQLALSLGLRAVRHSFYMQCHDLVHLPESVLPEGILLRPYVVGQDEEAFVAACNDAFSDAWDYSPRTLVKERHRLGAPGFQPKDNLLAVTQDGRVVGLCILLFPQMEGDMLRSNPPMIDDLAVTCAFRRREIGRALLLAGMRRIRDAGYSAAALAVDQDNPTQALRLYESVGFVVKSRGTVCRKELV